MGLEQLAPTHLTEGMEKRLKELKRVLKVLQNKKENSEKNSGSSPAGHLKITHKHGRPEFYHITVQGSARGQYIPVSEKELAALLAQKDYEAKLEKLLQREIRCLENYLRYAGRDRSIESLYERFCKTRQNLIEPVTLTDEQFSVRWKEKVMQSVDVGLPFAEDTAQYYTVNGERVRSKSEVIIADALMRNGVPYCYEVPLKLKRGGREMTGTGVAETKTFHPDFLCLNLRTRGEFYWEHFGMMDDDDYKRNAVGKINLYAENGFFPGRNLIITMETVDAPLNTRVVEKMIKEFLL